MKRLAKYLAAVFFLVVFIGKNEKLFSQDLDYKAHTLFLYNFMKYVEWPDSPGDFVVGVVGNSPIEKELNTLAQTKKIKGKKIVVKIINSPDEVEDCNMIYLPNDKSSMLKAIAEKVKSKSVLIVAEREGLARKGAGISFAVDDNDTLKFDINKSSLDSKSLKVANVLIQLGAVVG